MSKLSLLVLLLVLIALALGGLGLGTAYLETKTLQGTVTAPDGSPIGQAALTVAGRSTFSDDRGVFQIQFPRGEWELRAFADGFQEHAQKMDAADFWEQNYSAALVLDPKTWHGRVVSDDTQIPIPAARVELDGKILETDAQGEFIAVGVRSGSKIKISQVGYRTVNVTVSSTGSPKEVTTITLPPAETRVLVVDASNQKPLPGVRVFANGISLNTDANGRVVFKGLPQGVEISARAPGYATATQSAGEGQVSLELEPTTLQGRILDAATKQPVPDAILLLANAGTPAGNGQADNTAPSDSPTSNAQASNPAASNSLPALTVRAASAQGTFTLDDFSAVPRLYVKRPGYLLGTFDLKKGGAQDLALTPFNARGIHLYYGIKRADAERVLDQLKNTEMNAVVFDVKEDPGYLLWDSQVPLAKTIGAYVPRDYTANDQVATCKTYKLYCIARITVFKDKLLAQKRPDLGLHNAAGGLLYENSSYWTNPGQTEVQDYHIALAQELVAMGFDEVQYDYIRYPGTRDVLESEFGDADYRVKTIEGFLIRTAEALRPTPAFFSGDLFGLTTATNDEQGIGQVWEKVAPPFDYISPMMYPSTWRYATNLWGTGFGIKGCSDSYVCAYDIMKQGTLKAQQRLGNKWTLVRPWLQAYQMNLSQMLQQAQGAADANSAGYLFWNNLGIYPDGLFKKASK